MILNQKNHLLFFTFSALDAFGEIRHGIFSRTGGSSRGDFAGLNMSPAVGDDPVRVRQNQETIPAAMGGNAPVFLRQVHQTDVVIIDAEARSKIEPFENPVFQGDALVTGLADVSIGILTADCQAVFIYAPDRRVVAAVHAGWKGSIGNIIGRCIHVMKHDFGCDPKKMVAGISPSLGPCCAEFINYRDEIPKALWRYKDSRDHFDFWAMSRDQLTGAGLTPNHIEIAGICTKCNPHLFFSFRRSRQTGRFASVIGLK
jgi:polyphenol oxidase